MTPPVHPSQPAPAVGRLPITCTSLSFSWLPPPPPPVPTVGIIPATLAKGGGGQRDEIKNGQRLGDPTERGWIIKGERKGGTLEHLQILCIRRVPFPFLPSWASREDVEATVSPFPRRPHFHCSPRLGQQEPCPGEVHLLPCPIKGCGTDSSQQNGVRYGALGKWSLARLPALGY